MSRKGSKKEKTELESSVFDGDPDGNRTRVTAVKGRCLSRLTTGPSDYFTIISQKNRFVNRKTKKFKIFWEVWNF